MADTTKLQQQDVDSTKECTDIKDFDDLKNRLDETYRAFTKDYKKKLMTYTLRVTGIAMAHDPSQLPTREDDFFDRTQFCADEGPYLALLVSLTACLDFPLPTEGIEGELRCTTDLRWAFSECTLRGRGGLHIRQINDRQFILFTEVDFRRLGHDMDVWVKLELSMTHLGYILEGTCDFYVLGEKLAKAPKTKDFYIYARNNDDVTVQYASIHPDTKWVRLYWEGEGENILKNQLSFKQCYIGFFDKETGERMPCEIRTPVEFDEQSWKINATLPDEVIDGTDVLIRLYYMGRELLTGELHIGESVEGHTPYQVPGKGIIRIEAKEGARETIEEMIGLADVKFEIKRSLNYVRIIKARKERGLHCAQRLNHIVMTGNPGTGKTTVARLLASTLKELGLLSKGHLVSCDRESLTSMWIGETEKKTKQMIEESRGGCLFIDEAYSLFANGNARDAGRPVIDTLMPVLSDPEADIMVVMAGYPIEMERMLSMNPGLASRFPIRLHFADYSAAELMDIMNLHCRKNKFTMDEEAQAAVRQMLDKVVNRKDYGNGRFVYNLLNNFIIPRMGIRLGEAIDKGTVTACQLSTICAADIPPLAHVLHRMGMKEEAPTKAPIGFRR